MLEQRESLYGLHQVTAIDLTTRKPLGDIKVLGTVSVASQGESKELTGGSNPYPFAVETGLISSDITIGSKEIPDWFFPAFMGQTVTANAAEAGGAISEALANASGTSALDAVTGMASVTVKSGSEVDVKTSNYVIEAVTATTVNVYAISDVDFGQGAAASYVDNALKINTTPLAVTSGAATEIPGFGIEINGGSGTIGMTPSDTAIFTARSINSGSTEVIVGSNTDVFKEIGLLITSQLSSGQIKSLEVFRCKGIGIPFNFTSGEFAETEITLKAFRDEARNGVYKWLNVSKS